MKDDQWQHAVAARLESVDATGNPAAVLDPQAVVEAHQLARLMQDSGVDLESCYLLGWLHWYRYGALPEGQGQNDLFLAITMFTRCFAGGVDVEALPAPLTPTFIEHTFDNAVSVLNRATATADPHLVATAVEMWQRIVNAAPAKHPLRAALTNLENALQLRFTHTGNTADLNAAIRAGREGVAATLADDSRRGSRLSNLGVALWTRFERTGATADLDEAIRLGREATVLNPPGHPDRAGSLTNLSITLRVRFERTGDRSALDEAILASHEAVTLTATGHPSRPARSNNLGVALWARSALTGSEADLDDAVRLSREAAGTIPVGHPERPGMLSNLGGCLQTRFGRTGASTDLNDAITALQAAVAGAPTTHPNRTTMLSNLGMSLRSRFEQTTASNDLNNAITALQAAIAGTPTTHPNRAGMLNNLGTALRARFALTGATADLDEAVQVARDAVATVPVGHLKRPGFLNNLAISLRSRSERTGSVPDINEAITTLRTVVDSVPGNHPDRAGALAALANMLYSRFERTGALGALDEAIRLGRESLAATPAAHPERPGRLSLLGASLMRRFERSEAPTDVDEAIRLGREALAATPAAHPERPGRLSNLGSILHSRYHRTLGLADLDEAIAKYSEAIAAIPEDHSYRPMYLSNLANALHSNYLRTREASDLDEAIRTAQEAVLTLPASHPVRARLMSNLAVGLRARFRLSRSPEDLAEAVAWFMEVAETELTLPSIRMLAARLAGELVADTEPSRAAALLDQAVRLLPQVAPRQLDRTDQQYALGGFAGLAADAAALALNDPATTEDKRPALALRLLETGRAVLLSQSLETRSDLTDLARRHPEAAARFVELRNRLDSPSAFLAEGPADNTVGPSSAIAGPDRQRLATEWGELLAEIRRLPDFRTFAAPPEAEELLAQAADGPVVVFNISRYRSDALLLTVDGISCVPLPKLDVETVTDRTAQFHRALDSSVHGRTGQARVAAQQELSRILEWLWDTAAGPVLDALGITTAPALGQEWPRVWWATGGLLGLLPVHAAGHHSDPADPAVQADPAVLDRVVSSYIPTIGALRHARRERDATEPAAAGRSLIVAMPTTPGIPRGLDHVLDEALKIAERLPGPTVLSGPEPTRDRVLGLLVGCSIVHFACHGINDPTDPSHSRLLLHDHAEAPLTIAALAPVRLEHAQLAYLSACETALTTHTKLLDEAIHLASAFQLAGYPHVIGTLWAVNDFFAARIGDAFYAALTTGPVPEIDRAADGLHHAVRSVRKTLRGTPSLWAAHLHVGA
ncbi:CHAT domain-containing tetratricopeptide repeat protein [Streptomyces lavendulae]|uniref:CHAT domain-containing tetratricopeptide repeat protein n=1 Tax=Streptomyces lavendulae TaxID=1914 RepID=UPI0024A1C64A|nr:CHAT domain-containing tetratricopeptide repeat protein [Streptomyces lavendulae]GLV99150.1 CHAT domain-containing protein [Streptomyces lavendulae subsp. lavendulae]